MQLIRALVLTFVWCVARSDNKWTIELPISHEDPSQGKFELEYESYGEYYKPGGPVYLLLGGEGPLAYPNSLYITTVAQQTNGWIYQMAHRCFSTEDSEMLFTDDSRGMCNENEALQDFAAFITMINQKFFPTGGAKWITAGCSYAGRLATLMRLYYPDKVFASWASSAPMTAKFNFPEYQEYIRRDLAVNCAKAMSHFKNHVYILDQYSANLPGKCKQLFDENIVYQAVSSDAVQYNRYWNESYNNITDFCKKHDLYNCAGSAPMAPSQLKGLYSIYWAYKKCFEFGWFKFTTEEQWCKSRYAGNYDPEVLLKTINTENARVDRYLASASRVMIAYGTTDPWTVTAPTKSYPGVKILMIPGGEHCSDYYPRIGMEAEEEIYKEARKEILQTIELWLQQS